MKKQIVAVVGGSGFVGSYVSATLAKAGFRVNIISRNPEDALAVKTAGHVGQISLTRANILNESELRNALEGAAVVVNLVGILFERGKQRFASVHAQGAERVAKVAAELGAKRLIHMSALGVDQAKQSHYASSKLHAEQAVIAAFKDATILRPSIIFGAEDNFFNMFANLAKFSPALPLIGGGKTLFQPVYVQDVADAVLACIQQPESAGKIIELGGPKTYNFASLLRFMLQMLGIRRALIPLPYGCASLKAFFMELLPKPLLTRDQVRLLKYDNIVSGKYWTFKQLGLSPRSIEDIVPTYLQRKQPSVAA